VSAYRLLRLKLIWTCYVCTVSNADGDLRQHYHSRTLSWLGGRRMLYRWAGTEYVCLPYSLSTPSFLFSLFLSFYFTFLSVSPFLSKNDLDTETWGAGLGRNLRHINKEEILKNLCRSGVGGCSNITGERFPYYISVCTISWRSGNGTVSGGNCTQTMSVTPSSQWVSTARVSVLPPTFLDMRAGQSKRSQNTKEREILAMKLSDVFWTWKAPYTMNLTKVYWH